MKTYTEVKTTEAFPADRTKHYFALHRLETKPEGTLPNYTWSEESHGTFYYNGIGWQLQINGACSTIMESQPNESVVWLKEQEQEEEPKPVIVGHLNREFGYNYHLPIPKGSEVFEFNDRYYFIITPENEKLPKQEMRFYKETLKPCIDFIVNN
jgi:hypothetical protein